MRASVVSLVLLSLITAIPVAATGCSRKKRSDTGLPAASEWPAGSDGSGAPQALPPPPSVGPGAIGAQAGGDPHAGMDMSGAGGDPHAGVDMGGGGVDVAQMGLPPPDPSRAIDMTKFLRGSIHPVDATQDKIPEGAVIFINVKKADASGTPTGAPIAVDRLTATGWPLAFDIGEAKAMIGGTAFAGDVVITARYDQDGDAISKQPGDVTGSVRATIPAEKLDLPLDTVLP